MSLWALVELELAEAIEVFERREDADRALENVLKDEPAWRGALAVEPIALEVVGTEWTLRRVDPADPRGEDQEI